MSLMGSSGTTAKVLDIEKKIAGNDPYWYYDFTDIEGYENLSLENFSIIRIDLKTHGVSNGFGYVRLESYDGTTGILHLRHDGYLSTNKATFRITFGKIK